jgi:hypothetical protein
MTLIIEAFGAVAGAFGVFGAGSPFSKALRASSYFARASSRFASGSFE